MNNIVNKLEHHLRNKEIKDIHYHLNYLNKKLEFQKIELKKLLPSEVFRNIIEPYTLGKLLLFKAISFFVIFSQDILNSPIF